MKDDTTKREALEAFEFATAQDTGSQEMISFWVEKYGEVIRSSLATPAVPDAYTMLCLEKLKEHLAKADSKRLHVNGLLPLHLRTVINSFEAMLPASPKQDESVE